ncbi:MAG TPA: SDR family oxidoreductase [Bacilli bacterium]|nr:SDR family oxidoreductase [Bacilli bacterium]
MVDVKVLVVGANGQIGKQLTSYIQASDHLTAKAMIRKQEQASFFEDLGAETVLVDLEDSVESIAKVATDVDAIVFTAGSGPKTGKDKTLMIDLDGAIKTIEAAEKAGVKRFIMISSFDTTRKAILAANESFAPYVVAKYYADVWLRNTELDYTIIHPGILTNDAGTGKITAAERVERGEIPRDDVARVIFACLEKDATIGKEFQIVGGNTPINEAIDAL